MQQASLNDGFRGNVDNLQHCMRTAYKQLLDEMRQSESTRQNRARVTGDAIPDGTLNQPFLGDSPRTIRYTFRFLVIRFWGEVLSPLFHDLLSFSFIRQGSIHVTAIIHIRFLAPRRTGWPVELNLHLLMYISTVSQVSSRQPLRRRGSIPVTAIIHIRFLAPRRTGWPVELNLHLLMYISTVSQVSSRQPFRSADAHRPKRASTFSPVLDQSRNISA